MPHAMSCRAIRISSGNDTAPGPKFHVAYSSVCVRSISTPIGKPEVSMIKTLFWLQAAPTAGAQP